MATVAPLLRSAQAGGENVHSVRLRAVDWKSRPDLVGAGRTANPGVVEAEGAGLRFASEGPVSEFRSSKWTHALEGADLSGYGYVVLEYNAQWVERREVLAVTTGEGGAKPVLLATGTDLIMDGGWHKLIARKELPRAASELQLTLDSRSSRAYLTIRSLRFVASTGGYGVALPSERGMTSTRFRTIDLQKQFNTSYDHLLSSLLERPQDGMVNDSGTYFPSQTIAVSGVPFRVGTAGDNLVSPPPPPAANDDMIENFGVQVKRIKVAPISRDSLTEVSIGTPASEVFMLLATDFPSKRHDSGGTHCMAVEDVEWFAVELEYEDGTKDLAFPYSIQDGRHVIQRMLGTYVVPARGGTLKRVILHNRMLIGNIRLAALTVNTSKTHLFPQLIERPQLAPKVAEPPVRSPYARCNGSILMLGNRYLDLTIDTSKAFAITSLKNHWLGPNAITVASAPGLEVSAAGREFKAGDFEVSGIRAVSNGFEVTYSSRLPEVPLDLIASVSVEVDPEVRFLLTVVNKSAQPIDANIRFPKVHSLRIGANQDLWYMFPKYRNALSNLPGTYYSGAGCIFPMQFYDVFNPRLGGGVFVMTKELNNRAQKYFLRKTDEGASFYIEHPQIYTHVQPGEPYQYTETVIGVHPGDWRAGLKRYKDWLATWYKPYKAQQDSKAWYREMFWMMTEYIDVDRGIAKMPCWYDPATNHYRMRDIIEEFTRDVGVRPDYLHFWGWNWRPYRFGIYGEPNYKELGGLENFRAALDDIQQNLHVPVSLYIDPELCTATNPFCENLAPELAMRDPDGKIGRPYQSYRMCHYTQKWQDYMKSVYTRVHRETGVNILYVDEFANPNQFMCYATNHGHPVPLNMNEADYAFLKAIREVLPEELVLYGEFPATDVTSQFWDCNITYYNVGLGEQVQHEYDQRPTGGDNFSPTYLDLYRFVFPRIVQLVLPIEYKETSWHMLKCTFLNGQAHYDSFWDRFESKAQEFMTHAYRIKKEYRDCFTSDSPEMLVPTETAGLAANKWPGKGRTVWTLYNERYRTVRGATLAVDHVEAASYKDVWNDRPLEPVIKNGKAYLSLEMDPQSVGCVAQIR
jgi:hypothetical protein